MTNKPLLDPGLNKCIVLATHSFNTKLLARAIYKPSDSSISCKEQITAQLTSPIPDKLVYVLIMSEINFFLASVFQVHKNVWCYRNSGIPGILQFLIRGILEFWNLAIPDERNPGILESCDSLSENLEIPGIFQFL
ncbi:hypothetical protein G9A89_009607 [Geosiphon pyriformis]|nr:hypothetical protein G9A89_009607 [Geosiphon pyriformis]